ncbi:MAG: patatin-like phospholipase family protein, partial [Nitrososphaera sp.]|nr:patatin-like phospholipase family protein [Nitrososphaera sp.]
MLKYRLTEVVGVSSIPSDERVLLLQGGGSLGAYEVGAYRAAYQFLRHRDKEKMRAERQVFDIVAGTSIGAINSSILVSYVKENKTWEGSAERLMDFWNYLSVDSIPDRFEDYVMAWWKYWSSIFTGLATPEAARRYYAAKEFAFSGVPKVFSPPHAEPDRRFFDPFNAWYRYDNQPLKKSLERFAKFPIATSHDENEPRLLLVAVDVALAMPVMFDSYAKEDGSRETGYGRLILDENSGPGKSPKVVGFEHVIRYPEGITSDHVIASAAVPIHFDYVQLQVEDYNPKAKNYSKKTHYFWDGGILANTPLLPVITAHRRYWYYARKVKDAVPKLNVVLIGLHPAQVEDVPWDNDGVLNRNSDITYGDRTKQDETIALAISEYVGLAKKIIKVARDHGVSQKVIDDILDQPLANQDRLVGVRAVTYRDGIEGMVNIGSVIRFQRKHDAHSISNKIFDFSSNTIRRLEQNGYDDVVDYIKANFGIQVLEDAGLQANEPRST